jgi:tetratricopeptide (TPR) repeat protein
MKCSIKDLNEINDKWKFTGFIEKAFGLNLYRYFEQKEEAIFNDLIDSMELCGLSKEALELIKKEIGQPRNEKEYNNVAFLLWELKKYKEALNYFKKSLVLKTNPITYNSLGLIYNELGNNFLSEKYFKQGLEEFDDNITLLTNYAVLLFNLGKLEAANNIILKIQNYQVGTNFLHAGIGKILPPEYEIDLEEELKRCPKSLSVVLEIGKYMLKRGDVERTIDFLNEEMKKGNESAKIYSLLSYAYYYSFKFSEAETIALKAKEKFDNNIILLLTLVFLYVRREKYDKVLSILNIIKEKDVMYIEALFNVGLALENAGVLTKARLLFEWYLDVSDNRVGKEVISLHLEVINVKLRLGQGG